MKPPRRCHVELTTVRNDQGRRRRSQRQISGPQTRIAIARRDENRSIQQTHVPANHRTRIWKRSTADPHSPSRRDAAVHRPPRQMHHDADRRHPSSAYRISAGSAAWRLRSRRGGGRRHAEPFMKTAVGQAAAQHRVDPAPAGRREAVGPFPPARIRGRNEIGEFCFNISNLLDEHHAPRPRMRIRAPDTARRGKHPPRECSPAVSRSFPFDSLSMLV